jgi:hypothetical protein
MHEIFKEYQTLIVGGFGFAGVITTLFVNAWLDRRRHQRQILHESKTLRAALRSELGLLQEAFRDRLTMIAASKSGQSMLVPLDTLTDVYGRLIDRIGLLSEPEIPIVMRAYLSSASSRFGGMLRTSTNDGALMGKGRNSALSSGE